MANIQAIIVSVDTPETGWYGAKIKTNPSVIVYAVSLIGTLLKLGQLVSVIQYKSWANSPEFGFCEYGLYKSLIYLAPQNYDAITTKSPANTALGYVANLVGNVKRLYNPAIVTSVNSNSLTVTDRVTGSTPSLSVSILTPQDFNVGDGCLIGVKQNRVLGYWLTVPGGGGTNRIPWMFIARIQYTTNFEIGAMVRDNTGDYPIYTSIRSRIIPGTDPVMNFNWSVSSTTTNDDEYIYSQLNYRHTFGTETDVKYIKWHKKTLAYEFISAEEMPTSAAYNLAYGGRDGLGNEKPQKPWRSTENDMQQSDNVSPLVWYPIVRVSSWQEERFPYQNYEYKQASA